MVGDSEIATVRLSDQAKKKIKQVPTWGAFFRRAIDTIAVNPEPDGFIRRPAPPEPKKYRDCILYDVYPWRIVYKLDDPDTVTIVAIEIHPTQLLFL